MIEENPSQSIERARWVPRRLGRGICLAALKAALPRTVAILMSFWLLGLTYGIYMNACGFSWLYPLFMSLLIFGGSLEFIAASMLLAPFSPLATALVAFAVQARHIFYGIAMLDTYRGLGWKKVYLVFGMCDETFAINRSAEIPAGVDRGWFMFWVTLLNHLYWVAGATMGGIFGSAFQIEIEGLTFVMTALFVVIFLDQWEKDRSVSNATIGIGSSLICLAIFGTQNFIVPALLVASAFLLVRYRMSKTSQVKSSGRLPRCFLFSDGRSEREGESDEP